MSQESFGNPIVNLGLLYKTGLAVSYGSSSTVTVGAGQCRDVSNTWDIVVPTGSQTVPLTCHTSFVGVNGLDTGSVESNTMYGLFVIFDSTNLNQPGLLLSKSFTAPLMPSLNGVTYSAFRLIDFILTDGSSHILPFYNNYPTYGTTYKQYDAPISVLSSGAATSYTALDLSVAVPTSGFGRVKFTGNYIPHAAAETLTFKPTGATATAITIPGIVASVAQPVNFDMLPLISSAKPKISYAVSVGTSPAAANLSVLGYEFSV